MVKLENPQTITESGTNSESLLINNFGPIKNLEVDLTRFMLFIGTQASGKSTLAKLIAIFRKKQFVLSLKEKRSEDNYVSFFKDYNIHNYFSTEAELATRLEYRCESYHVIFNNNEWLIHTNEKFDFEVQAENSRIWDIISLFVKQQAKKPSNNIAYTDEYAQKLYQENRLHMFTSPLFKEPIYIPTERSVVSLIQDTSFFFKDIPLPSHFNEFGRKFQSALRELKEYEVPFLGIVFKNENGKFYIYHDETHALLLSETASGIQAIIPLMIVIDNYKGRATTLIVEEPELNLYPQAQKKLVNFLITNTNDNGSDLIITTHSPYLLSILNNYLYSHTVGNRDDNTNTEVKKILPQNSWINPLEFSAYFINTQGAISIFNKDTGLISENELDAISSDIAGEFDQLIDLNY
jgi:predicted ATP-dependent endonuclease of OLD family